MTDFKKIFPIKFIYIIFFVLLLIIFLLSYLLFFNDFTNSAKGSGIISGLLTGFIIVACQIWLSWYEFRKIDEYNELKIKKILSDRKDPVYYGDIISKAKKEIILQGITALSFLDDFANKNQNGLEKEKVLLKALERKVKVQILIADKSILNSRHKRKAQEAENRLKELSSYTNFEYRYYDQHQPTHSIVIIDDECIVGPIFPNVNSRDTPAIHLKRDSQLAKYYEDYFNIEWNECTQRQKVSTN